MNYKEDNQGVHVDQSLKNILIPRGNTAYHLTLFLWNPTTDAGAGTLAFLVQWTQPLGGVATATVSVNLAAASSSHTIDMTIWVLAGTPIQYQATGGGTYGAATYSYLLALDDISKESHDEDAGELSPIVPVPLPEREWRCGRCRRNPCCCGGGGGGSPNIIVVPSGGSECRPYREPHFMPYADRRDTRRLLLDDDSEGDYE